MATRSNRDRAKLSPTTHSFTLGRGFKRFGAHEVLQRGPLSVTCVAPKPPEDGSEHLLMPPGGNEAMLFVWHAGESAWCRYGGARLGFTADYLGSHGWTYVGPRRKNDDRFEPVPLVPAVQA